MQHRKEIKILLAESFKELVKEKPIEKITIKEITDKAGVIRVTFYNHFQDKYELVEWIYQEEIAGPMRILMWNGMIEEAMVVMFNTMLKNRDFYVHAAKLEGQNSFEEVVQASFKEMIHSYLEDHASHEAHRYKWLTEEWAAEFYSHSLTHLLISWIRSGMQESSENMVEMYAYFATHSLMDLPQEL